MELLWGQPSLWSSSFLQLPEASCLKPSCFLEGWLFSLRSRIWSQLGSPACNGTPKVWFPQPPGWPWLLIPRSVRLTPASHLLRSQKEKTPQTMSKTTERGKVVGLFDIYELWLLKMEGKGATVLLSPREGSQFYWLELEVDCLESKFLFQFCDLMRVVLTSWTTFYPTANRN